MLQTLGDYEQIVIGKEPNQFRYLRNTGVSLNLQTDSIFTTHRSIFLQSACGCLPSNYPRHPAMQPSKGLHVARPQILRQCEELVCHWWKADRLEAVLERPSLEIRALTASVSLYSLSLYLMPSSWREWCQSRQAEDIVICYLLADFYFFPSDMQILKPFSDTWSFPVKAKVWNSLLRKTVALLCGRKRAV